MSKKVIDEAGRIFETLGEALAFHKLRTAGWMYYRMNSTGQIKTNGHVLKAVVEDDPVEASPDLTETKPKSKAVAPKPRKRPEPAAPDPLMARLRERYSEKELEMIARGEGIEKKSIAFPEIHLSGSHHRMVVISDTHIGSVYAPDEWHDTVSDFVNDPVNGVDCVLHCGDLVDGLKIGRAGTQIYELSELGFDAQRAKAVELMSKYKKPVYIISGNHDMYFKEYAGANIVKAVCDEVPNMTYVGHDAADIDVDGCIIRLFHGGDGNSYALSYRLQKLVEAIAGGHKPNILLAGHVHKFCYIFERNIHAISAPCLQAQTSYMRGKKLAAHTGFLVLDFDTMEGNVCNIAVNFFPFYA